METRTIVGLGILVAAVLAVAAVALHVGTEAEGRGDNVALVELDGGILDAGSGAFGAGITPRAVRRRLDQAERDPRVGAVVMRVNSSGGGIAASQEIYETIERHPDPVVFSIAGSALSGGYYIASAADAILAHPGSQTGSIGVIFQLLDYSELLDELGVEMQVITSGERKDMFLPGRLDEEAREMMQEQSDQYHEQFIRAVAEGRGKDIEEVRPLATGETFTGEQALEAGLVDELGGLSTALDVAADLADLEDPEYVEREPGFFDGLVAGGGVPILLRHLLSEREATPLAELRRELNEMVTPLPDFRYQP